MANKVEFGISNVHIGTYSVSDENVVTLGTPTWVPGAVSLTAEEQSELSNFYADNIAYFTNYTGGNLEGELEVAKFSDEFKTSFLGYKTLTDGGVANVKNAIKPNVYMAFEIEGDAEKRRVIMYNGTMGAITREYNTIEDSRTPTTEKVAINFLGDNATGVTSASYRPTDSGYSKLFTAPTAPTIATE